MAVAAFGFARAAAFEHQALFVLEPDGQPAEYTDRCARWETRHGQDGFGLQAFPLLYGLRRVRLPAFGHHAL